MKTSLSPTQPAPVVHSLHNFFPTGKRRRVYQPHGSEPSATKQEFKDDCDINKIMARYQRTGALTHFAKYAGSYGDFTACDLQQAHSLMQRAREMFDALPSSIRNLVMTPEGFLNFVQDPANAARMAELGLTAVPPAGTPADAATPATPPLAASPPAGK